MPLAAETAPRGDGGSYRAEHFSFASEAGERVPGVFLKAARANGRRPAVIFLHGTGARKEDFLALMRTFTDRGFAAAAIDARHHGARIAPKHGPGNAQYFAAMLETYRTGKGRPYLYDTVDPRIAAAVPIIGVQGFRWALDNDQWQARVGTFSPAVEGAARDEGVSVDERLCAASTIASRPASTETTTRHRCSRSSRRGLCL